MNRRLPAPVLVIMIALAGSATAAPAPEWGHIELMRDRWGVPHVFAETDEGAMYGLGVATAEDRPFQMNFSLRVIQGRAAEVIGDAARPGRRETAVDRDRLMRAFGFAHAARAVAGRIDEEARGLLEAYCAGVNDVMEARDWRVESPGGALTLAAEEWTPADCIASWWHLGQFFATDGTRDLMQWRNRQNPERRAIRGIAMPTGPPPADEDAAVIQRGEVSNAWLAEVEAFAREHHVAPAAGGEEGPKFSHAWVAGAPALAEGAVLVSDPQTPVNFPSLFYEFHVAGKTFNARGIGVPGSPMPLIGFTEQVAWGLTALGADQADLFRLVTDGDHAGQYQVDGEWLAFETREETILVRGGEPVPVTIRETIFGPVLTEFAFAAEGDPEVALRRVPMCEKERETVEAMAPMLRARGADDFRAALSRWSFPSANIVYGDRAGRIGYGIIAAVPVRAAGTGDGGGAIDGSTRANDWQTFVPFELLPHLEAPASGRLWSANHRPIGSFYPPLLGISTGSLGDTVRSRRLAERLRAAGERLAREDVTGIQQDTVNPARRDIVRLAIHLRDAQGVELAPEATAALEQLEPWLADGAWSDLRRPGAALAQELNTFFRFVATPLALVHGGGESGLNRFLKDATARIDADPATVLNEDERSFIERALADAWGQCGEKFGSDPEQWEARAREAVAARRLPWMQSLDGFGGLEPAVALEVPALFCVDGGTIQSQAGQSYTQVVPLGEADGAMTLLPPGNTEQVEDRARTAVMEMWAKGELHPAPLTRAGVEKVAAERWVLSGETNR